MSLQRIPLLLIIFVLFLISACKNSDSWLGRTWHNTRAHYNTYFNAEQDWLNHVALLREGYKDDYRKFIELYNYGTPESLKGNQSVMDPIVKKLSSIIDKHPKSKWIDDSYLLMGKAYFMKGDFFAASDIFEYVNSNFKDPVITYKARLWIFQCLYYRGKLNEAENLIVSLKNDEKFPKSLRTELYKALGAVYLRNDKPSQAVEFLELSLKGAKGKLEKYRMHYALGQAYHKIKNWDKAGYHFARVVRLNPPYEMAFNSEINRVDILSQQKQDFAKANRILKRMLRDDKNLEYFGQIYYQMGVNEMRSGNETKALGYYNMSLRNSAASKAQTTTTYLTLGDYYFSHKDYERAGLYYDSANTLLDEKHPDYENIAKRSLVLGELLKNLLEVKRQDSLLALGRDPVLREKTIDRLIELEKKAAQQARNNPTPTPAPGMNPDPGGNLAGPSSFPFYNMNMRNRGIQEFEKNWGQRQNRDYWRLNARKSLSGGGNTNGGGGTDTIANQDTIPANTPENRKKYYVDIPMTKEAQEAAEKKIENALFAAAGVYQNSLDAPADALNLYQILLKRYPQTKLEPQVLYEMARISKAMKNDPGYENYKSQLESKYPESIYLRLLKDPNAKAEPDKNGPGVARKEIEELYTRMYDAWQAEKYTDAMQIKLEADNKYAGNTLQARFDYLYAMCQIKTGEAEKGIASLSRITSDYAGSEIAVLAQATIDAYNRLKNPQVSESGTQDTASAGAAGLWKKWDGKEELYCLLAYRKGVNSNLLRAGLTDFNKANFVFETLEVSPVRAFGESVYLSVANFSKPEVAQEYYKFMTGKADFFASKGLFEYDLAWISKSNYSILLTNNRINNYVDFFKTETR